MLPSLVQIPPAKYQIPVAANAFYGDRTEDTALPATLPNGSYKIAFETPSGAEYGVECLRDGKLRGGDSEAVTAAWPTSAATS